MKRKKKLPHRAIIHYNIDSITTFSQSPTKYPSMEDLSPPHTHTHYTHTLLCLFFVCSCLSVPSTLFSVLVSVRSLSLSVCLYVYGIRPSACLLPVGSDYYVYLSFSARTALSYCQTSLSPTDSENKLAAAAHNGVWHHVTSLLTRDALVATKLLKQVR